MVDDGGPKRSAERLNPLLLLDIVSVEPAGYEQFHRPIVLSRITASEPNSVARSQATGVCVTCPSRRRILECDVWWSRWSRLLSWAALSAAAARACPRR